MRDMAEHAASSAATRGRRGADSVKKPPGRRRTVFSTRRPAMFRVIRTPSRLSRESNRANCRQVRPVCGGTGLRLSNHSAWNC